MAHKTYPRERQGVEQIGPNVYRIGFQIRTPGPDGKPKRTWIRETKTYPDNLTHAQQLDLAEADLALLRKRHSDAPDDTVDIDHLPDEMTVAQLCKLWETTVLPTRSADYAKTASSMLEHHILPHLGTIAASNLTPLRINHWIALLSNKPQHNKSGKTLSKTTVRHCYITLSTIYNWALSSELVTSTPFQKTHAPKTRKHRPAFLDDDQAVDLLRRLQDVEDMSFRCAVMLALMCGLRLGEVDAITWSDIKWSKAIIDITKAVHQTPKTGRTVDEPKSDESVRLIHAPAALMALLDETRQWQEDNARILGDRWRGQGLIVCNFDGTPYNKDTPSRQWKKFAERNGFTGVTFHNLRTSHATILLSSSIDAVAVAGRMGHTDAATTLRYYAMVVAKRDQASANVMDTIAHRAGLSHNADEQLIHSISTTKHPDGTTLTIELEPRK